MRKQNAFLPQNAIQAALLYSGFISSTILSISIQKSSCIPLGCKRFAFLHDNLEMIRKCHVLNGYLIFIN